MSQIKFQLQPNQLPSDKSGNIVSVRQPNGIPSRAITPSTIVRERTISAIWAVLLAIIFDLIYLSTRTGYYSVDAVRIAQGIVTFHHTHSLTALFRPGYLLFGPLGLSVYHIAQVLGYHGGALPVLQSINALAGGIGIGLFSILLRQILTRSRSLTILIPIALGASFGYWMLATDGRAEMVAMTLVILTTCLLVRVMLIPTWQRTAGAGLALSAAIAFHIFSALFIPAAIVAILMAAYTQGDVVSERRARIQNVMVFLAATVVPVVILYLWTGFGLLALYSFHSWANWLRQGFETDWWVSPHALSDLRLDVYSIRRALFVEPGGKSGTFHLASAVGALPSALYWLSLLTWFIAVYMIASNTAFMMRTHYRPYLAVATTSILIYAIAFTYICPGYFVYWTPVVMSCSLVTAICASYYRGRRGGGFWLVGIACWTLVFGLSNYLLFIKPHENIDDNPSMIQAKDLQRHTSPGDLIIVSGFDEDTPIVVYAPFFVQRKVFSLRESLEEHNGDVVLTSRDLSGAVEAAVQSHHHAYAYADIRSDPDTRLRLSNVSREYNPQQVFDGLQRAQGWSDPSEPGGFVWKLIPTQTLAPSQ